MRPVVPEGLHVEYRHARNYDMVGERLVASPTGGVTLCFVKNEAGEVVTAGSAKCNARDNFNKRIGRDISLGRALKSYRHRTLEVIGHGTAA